MILQRLVIEMRDAGPMSQEERFADDKLKAKCQKLYEVQEKKRYNLFSQPLLIKLGKNRRQSSVQSRCTAVQQNCFFVFTFSREDVTFRKSTEDRYTK